MDESWEEDRLVIDLEEGEQLEPVKDTINAEPDEEDAGVIIAKMPDMLISVNPKYKYSSEYKKLEKIFKIPPQQTPCNAPDITDIEFSRPLSRVGLRNESCRHSRHFIHETRANDVHNLGNFNASAATEGGMENHTYTDADTEPNNTSVEMGEPMEGGMTL